MMGMTGVIIWLTMKGSRYAEAYEPPRKRSLALFKLQTRSARIPFYTNITASGIRSPHEKTMLRRIMQKQAKKNMRRPTFYLQKEKIQHNVDCCRVGSQSPPNGTNSLEPTPSRGLS